MRQWGADPSTSLSELPVLSEEHYDKAAFARFAVHLTDAIAEFMAQWNTQLAKGFASATSAHDLAVELVRLRNTLQPRVQLAAHPGLPAGVRDALAKGLAADVTSIQTQLEESVRVSTSRGSVDPQFTDMMLRIVRENPVTSVLTPAAHTYAPGESVPSHPATSSPPAMARRILTPIDIQKLESENA